MKKLILSLALLLTSAAQAAEITVHVNGFFSDPYYAADHRSFGEDKTRQIAIQNLEYRANKVCIEYGGKLLMTKNESLTKIASASRYAFSVSAEAICTVDVVGQCAQIVVERNDATIDIAMDACRIEIERRRGEKQINVSN